MKFYIGEEVVVDDMPAKISGCVILDSDIPAYRVGSRWIYENEISKTTKH